MTLPSITKTWQHDVNNQIPAQATALAQNKLITRTLKDILVGFGTQAWVVVASSDSSGVKNIGDGAPVDLWTTDAKLVWGTSGSVHSWVVLKQTGLATDFMICIDLVSPITTNGVYGGVYFSPSGYNADGTTTARPSAPANSEVQIKTGTNTVEGTLWCSLTTAYGYVLHVMLSTDGQVTRIFGMYNGYVQSYWEFSKVQNFPTGWATPFVGIAAMSSGVTSHITSLSALNAATVGGGVSARLRQSTTVGSVYLSAPGWAGDNFGARIGTIANDISGEWPIAPVGVACETANARGLNGQLYDLWWGGQGVGVGDTYPNDTSRLYAQFYNLVVPWDGTVPVTA